MQSHTGTLETGKQADIILVDATAPPYSAPHLQPTQHLLRTLVMSAGAHDVSDVIVDGVVLMQERRLTQVDEAEIICKAGEHLQAITRRAGIA